MNETARIGFSFPIPDLTLLSGSTKQEHSERFDIGKPISIVPGTDLSYYRSQSMNWTEF